MASLINRIQRAMLGSAGAEKVRVMLVELAIPAGGSGGNMREVRRGFLRPISDEAILRDALANIGLSGSGGGGTQALSRIRTAILHNLRDSEVTLREGLNGLLTSSDLGGGSGGGETPAWVPTDAAIHIDFLGNRAWSNGTGVGIDTLLGSDSENGFTYDAAKITAGVGYKDDSGADYPAFIGASFALMNAGSTLVLAVVMQDDDQIKLELGTSDFNHSVDLQADQAAGVSVTKIIGFVFPDSFPSETDEVSNASGIIKCAANLKAVDFAFSMNGRTAISLSQADAWVPFDFIGFYVRGAPVLQSITLYDPLPDTTGLSELSEIT